MSRERISFITRSRHSPQVTFAIFQNEKKILQNIRTVEIYRNWIAYMVVVARLMTKPILYFLIFFTVINKSLLWIFKKNWSFYALSIRLHWILNTFCWGHRIGTVKDIQIAEWSGCSVSYKFWECGVYSFLFEHFRKKNYFHLKITWRKIPDKN